MSSLIFGFHAVEAILRREPNRIQSLWLQEGRRDKRVQSLETLARNQGVALNLIGRTELDDMVDGRHQGVVAKIEGSGGREALDERGLIAHLQGIDQPLVLVLDGVTDPHNLGACLRSADAAGVNAVVVPKDRSADLGPTVSKVAWGAAESIPFARVTNLSRTLEKLKEAGFWLVGTTGEADITVYDQDLTGPLCLIMGAEGDGMRRLTLEHCDFLVKLPMAGTVESLNVSVATGICLFEAVRQRTQ